MLKYIEWREKKEIELEELEVMLYIILWIIVRSMDFILGIVGSY